MSAKPLAAALKILQVSSADLAGGAERSALNLFEQFAEQGHHSWLAVGHRHVEDGNDRISRIDNATTRNALVRTSDALIRQADRDPLAFRGLGRAARLARTFAEPVRRLRKSLGHEDFDFPGTRKLLQLPPWTPDIVHCHNLHGGYFDLRELPRISTRVATVLNLRDAWLLSGHCAFGLDCERWRHGCGQCPDLQIYPAIARDATAYNWRRKRAIYARSRVHVTAPSRWLLDQARESMLAPAIVDARVIPNGIDTRVFKPGDRRLARDALGIDSQATVVMLAAAGIRNNVWKDYRTLRRVIESLGAQWQGGSLLVLAVGSEGGDELVDNAQLRFVPFVRDARQMALHYQASDLYLHAATVESFGNVLLEAKACGLALVTTAVGGIPEHVHGLNCEWSAPATAKYSREQAHGVLSAVADVDALLGATLLLLGDQQLREELGRNGAEHARQHGSLRVQANRFIDWYRQILAGCDETSG